MIIQPTPTVAYIWSYIVQEQHRHAFRRAYGPDGAWAELFRRSDGYRGTDLFEDQHDPRRFLTIDHFAGRETRARFLELHRDDYRALDERWQQATLAETFIGEFVSERHG